MSTMVTLRETAKEITIPDTAVAAGLLCPAGNGMAVSAGGLRG